MSYEEKIDIILGERLETNCNYGKVIADVKIWLCCELQCGMIKSVNLYKSLCELVDLKADKIMRGM